MSYEILIWPGGRGKVIAYPGPGDTPPKLDKPCEICGVYALVPRKGPQEGYYCVNCANIARATGIPAPIVPNPAAKKPMASAGPMELPRRRCKTG